MKRRRIIGIGAAVIGGLGLLGAVALPGLVQSRVQAAVDHLLEQNVDADVTVGKVDVWLFRSFPSVTVVLSDVRVAGRDSFEGVDLAKLPSVELGIDAMSAISGSTLEIAKVTASGGHVHVVYDREGRANWDVLPDSDGEDEYRLRLEHVVLSDLDITYEDRQAYLITSIENVAGLATADLTQSLAKVDSNASVESLTMRYGGVTWLRATRWESKMAVDIDQTTGAVTFGENRVQINELPLKFSGVATPTGETWDVDLGVEATDTSFAALLSLVPDAYGAEFADVDASGKVRFKGTIDGEYDSTWETLPSLDFDLGIENGRFQFPNLPSAVDRVSTQMTIAHPGGDPDKMTVDARHFELSVGGAGLKGRMKLEHPMTDPELDGMVDGRLDLGALRRALPASVDAPEVDGTLDLDFTAKGRMSDFDKQRVERIEADGTIRGKGLRFDWYDQPVEIDRVDLALSPLKTELNALDLRTMGSDVRLSGNIDNLFPWMLTDADLSGQLGLQAGRVDLRPFQGESDADTDTDVLFVVPDNVDLTLLAAVDRLVTDDFTMRGVTGTLTVDQGVMSMKRLKGRMLGGQVTVSGTYAASSTEEADVDLQLTTSQTSIGDTLATFETLKAIAPVLNRAVGSYSSSISMRTKLGRDGSPNLSILSSAGDVSPLGMTLQTATLNTIATQLKNDRLASMNLDGTRLFYAFDDGRVEVRPFTAKLGPQKTTIAGSFGPLDKSLALSLDVPIDTGLIKGAKVLGAFGRDLPKKADVQVQIGGSYDKPKIKVGLSGEFIEEAVDAALDPLVAAATEQGDKLLAEARAAADTLIAEAEKAADTLLSEAKKKARQLKRDAKGKPLEELAAKTAASLLEKEGSKAAKKAVREAEKAADKLVDEAKLKRDQLIADATAKAKAKLR